MSLSLLRYRHFKNFIIIILFLIEKVSIKMKPNTDSTFTIYLVIKLVWKFKMICAALILTQFYFLHSSWSQKHGNCAILNTRFFQGRIQDFCKRGAVDYSSLSEHQNMWVPWIDLEKTPQNRKK